MSLSWIFLILIEINDVLAFGPLWFWPDQAFSPPPGDVKTRDFPGSEMPYVEIMYQSTV